MIVLSLNKRTKNISKRYFRSAKQELFDFILITFLFISLPGEINCFFQTVNKIYRWFKIKIFLNYFYACKAMFLPTSGYCRASADSSVYVLLRRINYALWFPLNILYNEKIKNFSQRRISRRLKKL